MEKGMEIKDKETVKDRILAKCNECRKAVWFMFSIRYLWRCEHGHLACSEA